MKDTNQQIKTQHLRQTHPKKDETSASVRKYMIPPQFQSQTLLQLTRHSLCVGAHLKFRMIALLHCIAVPTVDVQLSNQGRHLSG